MEMDKNYEHSRYEQESRELWERENIYKFKPDQSKKVFSIDTPPPTVSGSLHIGHVFSYTHADLIARYKKLMGFNVFYPMGFDDNGLGTERFVEKKNGVKGYLMKRSDFVALCAKDAAEAEKEFEKLWRKLALSIDWTKTYSTISAKTRKLSQRSFIDLYKRGFVYRKQQPALYCTTCRTSVAQAELDNAEKQTMFNDIEFLTEDGKQIIIATTRPELLGACVAVFYHPNDERYKHLAGKFAITPIYNKKVPFLADDKVEMEKGSGIVMCCTFGDQTDIYWYKKHNLPFIQVVGIDGKWTNESGDLAGLNVHDARKKIIELLKENGKLLSQKAITHNVNTHERCKQEIEYLVLMQWFVKILDYKEKFLELADQINWYPEFMKARYRDWVQNLNMDWCISRQRFSGVPFPVWHCTDCKEVILADDNILPVDPQEKPFGKKCPKCSSVNVIPDTDMMDTWNTSSLTPQINISWPESSEDNLQIPMGMRPQAHDIIRTWAFYTIIKSFFHHNNIPWNDIVISGHVLAGKEKISKSKENAKTSPEALLETLPADVVRYWAANAKLGNDTAFSENQLKIGQRLLTKLWNAFRFCQPQLELFDKSNKPNSHDVINEWLLHEFGKTWKTYHQYFASYDYQFALESVEKFFWSTFCDNYIELVKDQIFNPDKYSPTVLESTRYTLHEICFGLVQLLAPFLPHITETLYQQLLKAESDPASIHLTQFDDKRYQYEFSTSAETMGNILEIVSIGRRLKTELKVSLKTELAELVVYCSDQESLENIKPQANLLSGILNAQKIIFTSNDLDESRITDTNGAFTAHVKI